MLIYFEDGYLQFPMHPIPTKGYHRVYAAKGYFECEKQLDKILESGNPYDIVYTNSVAALQNKYCWNEMTGCTLYLRDKCGEWYNANAFTHKELRQTHNFFHLYRTGEFGMPKEREAVAVYCQNCFEVKLPPERHTVGHRVCSECEASMTEEAFDIDLNEFFKEDEE